MRRTSRRSTPAYGGVFRWHFIGHLQSRKATIVNETCELVHSLDSESAARRLRDPRARRGQPLRRADEVGGRARTSWNGSSGCYGDVRGLMTMPPLASDPEASRPYFRRLRELAADARPAELSMGTSQDYRVAVEEGATMIRVGSALWR